MLFSHFALALGLLGPAAAGTFTVALRDGRKECTVTAGGGKKDDSPAILTAFTECNNGGKVIFPASQRYWIASRMKATLQNVDIEWRGRWTYSDDLAYWRRNAFPVAFQNHAAGFILSGRTISIDGHGTGGIDGNGDAWYNAEKRDTRPGRPMPFVLWAVSRVTLRNFSILQPQLWALNVMNGTDLNFENIYVNATATKAPWGQNWVQNTDGFDTMDVRNARLVNFVYQGGDDCVAIKPRSYNIEIRNATCRGGNGIAIGSLGQYLEDSSVENVVIRNVKIIRYNEDMHESAYIKTWIGGQTPQRGYESAGVPRGGGWGVVKNITLSDFDVQGADGGPAITQDNGNDGHFAGTSKMEISHVTFENFRGYLSGRRKDLSGSVSCSKVHPCHDIVFRNVKLRTKKDSTSFGSGKCKNVKAGGIKGLSGSGCK